MNRKILSAIGLLAILGISITLLTSQTTSLESVKKATATNELTEDLKTGAHTLTISSAGAITVQPVLNVDNTTEATTLGVGALVVDGGIYSAKKIYAEQVNANQDATFRGATFGGGPPGSAAGNVIAGNTSTLGSGNASTLGNNVIGQSGMAFATGSSLNNVSVGHTSGSHVGSISGANVTTPTNCVYLGGTIYTGSATPDYEIVIGANSIGRGSNTTTIGTLGQTNSTQIYGTGVNRGYLYGLTMSNNGTDATNDIDIASGEARDSTGVITITLGSSITKRLDASWAVGTGQGGLDTGSIANTTYHIWLIMRSDTGVVDALFSTSASAPTMPANYDYKRRIGSIVRAGATILAFIQDGDSFSLVTPVLDVSVTNLSTSRTTYTLASMPTGFRMEAIINTYISHASSAALAWISDLSQTDSVPSASAAPLGTIQALSSYWPFQGNYRVWTNTSAQIGARSTFSSTTLRVVTVGWIDRRGRDN